MSQEALATIQAQIAAGDFVAALDLADQFLVRADLPVDERIGALKLRAHAHEERKEFRAAAADLEGVLALAPNDARACNSLGLDYADAGDPARALLAFQRAVTVDPGFARGWNNYGNGLRGAGRLEAAADAFHRATAADPAYALAYANLGAVLRDLGDEAGAEAALSRALQLVPGQRTALAVLAGVRRQQGRIDDAALLYTQLANLDPRNADVFQLFGATVAERDELDRARGAYEGALARDPKLLRAAIARQLTLPNVPDSAAALWSARSGYLAGLELLATELPMRAEGLGAARVVDELRWTNFLLAYQGENDVEPQRRYGEILARLLAPRLPDWLPPPSRRPADSGRIRVGFVSAFFRECTAGRYFEHWITGLPANRFDVTVYHLHAGVDELGERIRARADTFRACARMRPSEIAPRIRDDAQDVLVYPELGMDGTSFALATLRLAPRQVAGWGHPSTTGLPEIDEYFSCAAMEPADASAHYTEKLRLLPGIGTRYPRPAIPAGATRADFGLPEGVPLLLCPQSLFKIHPDNDALYARVLAALPESRLVLFDGRHPALTARYRQRLGRALAAAGVDAARVVSLPQCGHADYLRINTVCDVMLDTLRWSGGNTALDALAAGLPPVTQEGALMRGRQCAAMLRQAGVPELIAADADAYVALVRRLVTDRDHRGALSARLRTGAARVFDDRAPIDAFASLLAGR